MRKVSYVLYLGLTAILFSCHKDRKPIQPGGPQIAPILSTSPVTDISSSSAASGGTFLLDGTYTITSKGVQWDTSKAFPNNWKVAAGSGASSFSVSLPGLTPSTTFYVRAYAIADSTHIWYGDTVHFMTTYVPGDYQVSTIAGTGASGRNDGDSAEATFAGPEGAAIDLAGNIYIADAQNHAIRKITPDGTVSTLAVLSGAPSDVITDSAGNVYVAQTNWVITKATPAGQISTLAGSSSQGHLDGTGTAAEFEGPITIAIDPAGNLYVGDGNAYRKVTPAGVVSTLPNYFSGAECLSIAVDPQYNIYECTGYQLAKLDSSGNGTFLAGSGKTGYSDGTGATAAFGFLNELRLDRYGNIFGSDATNNKIRMITQTGVVTTIAGTGAAGGQDGNSAIATFHAPIGLAIAENGDIIVPDSYNNKIRRISHL